MAERIDYTLTITGPFASPAGNELTRIVAHDSAGRAVGWYSIDRAGNGYGPFSEHPDRELLGFPEGIEQPFSFSNGVDEGWACPSYADGLVAALFEHAVRVYDRWYRENRP